MKNIHVIFTIGLLVLFIGCIILPTTEYVDRQGVKTRSVITKESLEFIHLGNTTKEKVLLRLGEPDLVWKKEKIFLYRWVVAKGIIAYASPGPGTPVFFKECLLLIEFDEKDIVKRYEIKAEETGFYPPSRFSFDRITGW